MDSEAEGRSESVSGANGSEVFGRRVVVAGGGGQVLAMGFKVSKKPFTTMATDLTYFSYYIEDV